MQTVSGKLRNCGVDLPILFRAWAEVFIASDYESDTAGIDMTFKDGNSIGIGFIINFLVDDFF